MKKILTLVATVAFCVWMLGCGSGSKNNNGFTVSGSGTSGATAALAYLAGSANDFIGIKVASSPTAVPTAGSPYSFSSSVNSLAIRNNLLFVALGSISGAPSTINGYKADANGALTQLSSISLNGESTLAYDQSGKFLYAGNNFVPVPGQNSTAPGVYGFSVDQSSGVLTPLPGSPWVLAEGLSESALVVSPNGNLICFAVGIAQGTGNVDCYP